MRLSPSIPSCVVAMPCARAIARPSEAGSIPTTTASSMFWGYLIIFIIKSVPMLPEPMIAALTRAMAFSFGLLGGRYSAKRRATGVTSLQEFPQCGKFWK